MEVPTTGLEGLALCQQLAQRTQRQPKEFWRPSGAQIFYYTHHALQQEGYAFPLLPTELALPDDLGNAFLLTAPHVAEGLRANFRVALRWRTAPLRELLELMRAAGQEESAVEVLIGREAPSLFTGHAPRPLQTLAPIHSQINVQIGAWIAERVPVVPIARLQDASAKAFRLLLARLAQDSVEERRDVPLAEIYLYTEPLPPWLARLVQSTPSIQAMVKEGNQEHLLQSGEIAVPR